MCCIYGGAWVSASSAILREVAPILLRPNGNDDKESETELSAGSLALMGVPTEIPALMDDPTEFPADFDILPPFGFWVFIVIISARDLLNVAF